MTQFEASSHIQNLKFRRHLITSCHMVCLEHRQFDLYLSSLKDAAVLKIIFFFMQKHLHINLAPGEFYTSQIKTMMIKCTKNVLANTFSTSNVHTNVQNNTCMYPCVLQKGQVLSVLFEESLQRDHQFNSLNQINTAHQCQRLKCALRFRKFPSSFQSVC